MRLALAIGGTLLCMSAIAGAICYANYANSTDEPTVKGFLEAAKQFCVKDKEDADADAENYDVADI